MSRTVIRRLPWLLILTLIPLFASAQQADDRAAKAKALDLKVIADAQKGAEVMANLTYLADIIGPRLTGSAALKKANDWAADKMKAYGLVSVHHEPWLLPEGWERGTATGRLLEPDNGRSLTLASYGWHPGTNGKVQGAVSIVLATKSADLAGEEVARAEGKADFEFALKEPGAYRLEAWLRLDGELRPWILANPIYVR